VSKQKQACAFNNNNLKLGFASGELTNSNTGHRPQCVLCIETWHQKKIPEDLAIVSKEVNEAVSQ